MVCVVKKTLLISIPLFLFIILAWVYYVAVKDDYEVFDVVFVVGNDLAKSSEEHEYLISETAAYGWYMILLANRAHAVREELTFDTAPLSFPADEVINDGKTGIRYSTVPAEQSGLWEMLQTKINGGYWYSYYHELSWSIVKGDPTGNYHYKLYVDDELVSERIIRFK